MLRKPSPEHPNASQVAKSTISERFTQSQIIEIGYQIAVALEFCHSRNILHQDMKPMNGKLFSREKTPAR